MGKKSKFKQLRRLASQMPEIQINVVKAETVTGREVMAENVKEVDGKPIVADGKYRKKSVVQQPLNHNRKMKKLYNQHGIQGVNMYVNAVNRHITAQKIKENELSTQAK